VIFTILEILTTFIINLISDFGYFGIFIDMTIESASIPLPSEIIMPFTGFLVFQGRFDFWLVVFVGFTALGLLLYPKYKEFKATR